MRKSKEPQAAAPVDTAKPGTQITPPPEWVAHSPFGLMRADNSPAGALVSLVDVAAWMRTTRQWPRRRVLRELFGPLRLKERADNGGVGGAGLWVAIPGDYAVPLVVDGRLNQAAARAVIGLEFGRVGDAAIDVTTDLAEAWESSWPGDAIPDEFYRDGWITWCRLRRRLAEDGAVEFTYLTLEQWRAERLVAMQALEHVAVTHRLAHELWGWGELAVAHDAEGAALPTGRASASEFPLADFAALAVYRSTNTGADWGLGNQLALLKGEIEARVQKRGGGASAIKDQIAGELGLGSRQAIDKVLQAVRKRPAARKGPQPDDKHGSVLPLFKSAGGK